MTYERVQTTAHVTRSAALIRQAATWLRSSPATLPV